MIKNSLMLALVHHSVDGIKTTQQTNERVEDSFMTHKDVHCYTSRYPDDVNLNNARQHFDTIGQAQGRLNTCCNRWLTDYESQSYLDMNPSLQKSIGRGGPGSKDLKAANQHYMTVGYNKPQEFLSDQNLFNTAQYCGNTELSSCLCQGTMYMGVMDRPDNKLPIKSFNEMRNWKTVSKITNDWTYCKPESLGGDQWPGLEKQCWCEPAPQYEPIPCATEGENCLCNGAVIYGRKFKKDDPSKKRIVSFNELVNDDIGMTDAKNTQSIQCVTSSFGNVDPLPNVLKQCFCDEKKWYVTDESIQASEQYWKSQMVQSSMTVVLETTSQIVSKADTKILAIEETTSSKKVSETNQEKAQAETTCATCTIGKANEKESKDKKQLEEEKLEREKAEAIEKEKVEREEQEAIRRKKEADALQAAAELAESSKQKAMMIEESKRMKDEADRLEAIASIEREKIQREEEASRQSEIKRLQQIETERIRSEQIAIDTERQEEIVNNQRRAEIERARVVQEKLLIEQKLEAEIVRQKSIAQMEQALIESDKILKQQILDNKDAQRKRELKMLHINNGTETQEEIAVKDINYETSTYEKEMISKNLTLTTSQTTLKKITDEQNKVIISKNKDIIIHQKIKEETQNATIVLNKRLEQVQKDLVTTTSSGPTAGQWKFLDTELKQIQSEIETNTKIAELESKVESQDQNEADAAKTIIYNQEQKVNQLLGEVIKISDQTQYIEGQRESIIEQKKEEKLEKDVVKVEVDAFRANETAISEISTYREMESQNQILASNLSSTITTYGYANSTITKSMLNRTIVTDKLIKQLNFTTDVTEKEKLQKEITVINTDNERDAAALVALENELKIQEAKVKEAEEISKVQQNITKQAEAIATQELQKVYDAKDIILKNCAKQIELKKTQQKKQEVMLDAETKKLVEIETVENAAIEISKSKKLVSEKIVLDSKNKINDANVEIAKLKKEQGRRRQNQEEIQKIRDETKKVQREIIIGEKSKIKSENEKITISSENISTQKLVVKTREQEVKTAKEQTVSTESSCMSSTSVMISSSSSNSTTTTSTSTATTEYSMQIHQKIITERDEANEKRDLAQKAYQAFKLQFKLQQQKIFDLKRKQDAYTLSLEEYKSALNMFEIKDQELQNRIKATQNETVKAGYQSELVTLNKEKESTIKLIETTKIEREEIITEITTVKTEIRITREHITTIKLEAKTAEDKVIQTIMSQTGGKSVCEKKKILAQQKQIEAEKNEKIVAEQKDTNQEKIKAMQVKLAAHQLNQQESLEVVESLLKRKSSVEAETLAGNQTEIITTIDTEIQTEKVRSAEEKIKNEALDTDIKNLTAKIVRDTSKAQTSKDMAKKAYDEAVESCGEASSSGSTEAQEYAFKQAALATEEQRLALEDEIAEMKLIEEQSKQFEQATITRINTEIKASTDKQTEAQNITDSLYKEINTAKIEMSKNTTNSGDIAQLQADIAAREKKIDDQKDIIIISMEERKKDETEQKLIKDSIQEGEAEIVNMTAQAETIQKQANGAKQQAIDYLVNQKMVDEREIQKIVTEENNGQKQLDRLEKQLIDTTNRTIVIQAQKVIATQDNSAAELAYALVQKQSQKSEEDSLITTCTKLYVEKRELFTGVDKAMSPATSATSPFQSCLTCGSGSTGVTQITVQISNKALIDTLVEGLFENTLVADIEEVTATKKTSSVNGTKVTNSAPAGTKLVMVTSDQRTAELLAAITKWSSANDNAAGDVIATPFKYGKQVYFDFVKEATKKKAVVQEMREAIEMTPQMKPVSKKTRQAKEITPKMKQMFSQFAEAEDFISEPLNFAYVQMGKNEGVVSKLMKNISH